MVGGEEMKDVKQIIEKVDELPEVVESDINKLLKDAGENNIQVMVVYQKKGEGFHFLSGGDPKPNRCDCGVVFTNPCGSCCRWWCERCNSGLYLRTMNTCPRCGAPRIKSAKCP